MNRWKVERQMWPDGPAWAAVNERGHDLYIYDTHAKALAFADRMARTVDVVLPRANTTPPRKGAFWRTRVYPGTVVLDRYRNGRSKQVLEVGPLDLKPLAELLLAEHYKMEEI